MISGDPKQAIIFARRAQRALPQGSRAWLQADDIIKTVPRELRERGQ
jgi:predicted Zn-dependent protease